ncbi:MAG: rhamnogalacturonan lyase [Lachnospiraceae bacterium]|nr:rhamnogalacturonan lyase [Lachnospiraceae bacterium]
MKITIKSIDRKYVTVGWDSVKDADSYALFWADSDSPSMVYQKRYAGKDTEYTLLKSTHIPHWFYAEAYKDEKLLERSEKLASGITYKLNPRLEKLNRGLVALGTGEGIFLAWRMFRDEVRSATATGMTGTDYIVYRNGRKIAEVTDSTNWLDRDGKEGDSYSVSPVADGREGRKCTEVSVAKGGKNYIEIPLRIPGGGVTKAGEGYSYSANDMSVGDIDGDGELEFFVKWDPSNSHDVSQRGYTGNCYIDCYKMSGRLLWRLDMGRNIRAGAHYTQFMVYDFDGDGKAEMSVKTAPGTKMTVFDEGGDVISERFITLPDTDIKAGITHEDNYVCSAADFYEYTVNRFMNWGEQEEVRSGQWPATLEECWEIPQRFSYPLSRKDASALADYFMDEYAPAKDEKNRLREFEGFIYEGPEYLTMFAGDGRELETIEFPVLREDDGMRWGDYAWRRIEPCNRVDRFQSAVAYLDGENPYLIICRGYYTRTTITAYRFRNGRHEEFFRVDSGYVPMDNPFNHHSSPDGTDPVYGCITGQGDHSLSVADIDGDGCHEIIYGACAIDHDGSVLYSSKDEMPDGRMVKLGHGDSMHVARINPDRPGYEIFNVFEGGPYVPYGYALRDAETGNVLFGERGDRDLGRCMIGDICPDVRGMQVWVSKVRDCEGNFLDVPTLGTNANIKWAADLSTQVIDGVDYIGGRHNGVICDNTHGVLLMPENCATNNGTKGNPCLVADILGDFREQLVLRTADSSAIRIYFNTEITKHKLFTLLHDPMYRCGVAWQNNVYNQPCYTSFYYASDMDFRDVLPELGIKK